MREQVTGDDRWRLSYGKLVFSVREDYRGRRWLCGVVRWRRLSGSLMLPRVRVEVRETPTLRPGPAVVFSALATRAMRQMRESLERLQAVMARAAAEFEKLHGIEGQWGDGA